MCLYILAVVPRTQLTDEFRALAAKHDVRLVPFANRSLAKQLHPHEEVFVTTSGHCDCGSPLFGSDASPTRTSNDARLARIVDDKRRRGWGEATIRDWLDAGEVRDASDLAACARLAEDRPCLFRRRKPPASRTPTARHP